MAAFERSVRHSKGSHLLQAHLLDPPPVQDDRRDCYVFGICPVANLLCIVNVLPEHPQRLVPLPGLGPLEFCPFYVRPRRPIPLGLHDGALCCPLVPSLPRRTRKVHPRRPDR